MRQVVLYNWSLVKLSKITYLYLYIPDLTLGALGVMYEIPKSGPITISTGIDQPD